MAIINLGPMITPQVASGRWMILKPCGITARTRNEERKDGYNRCDELAKTLTKAGVKTLEAGTRGGYTPGYKFTVQE